MAPVRFAPVRLAPVRTVFVRFAFERFALAKFTPDRSCPDRFEPERFWLEQFMPQPGAATLSRKIFAVRRERERAVAEPPLSATAARGSRASARTVRTPARFRGRFDLDVGDGVPSTGCSQSCGPLVPIRS